MNKLTLVISALLLTGIFSCKSEADEKKKVDLPTEDQDKQEQMDDQEPQNEVVYSIPSPSEQYDLLQALGGEVDPTAVNELSNMSKYTTQDELALNFGVYLSDASYMMRYDQGKKVFLDYVSTLDEMGQELDITKVYGEDLLKKVEEIGADSEKLFELTSDNYLTIYDQMIANDKGAELSMILGGSWIETMHILFNASGEFEENFEIQEYIVDQKYIMENLIGFVSDYSDDEGVKKLQGYLSQIAEAYDQLDCRESKLDVKKDEETIVLDGGSACIFTESSYNNLKSVINEIRGEIIS